MAALNCKKPASAKAEAGFFTIQTTGLAGSYYYAFSLFLFSTICPCTLSASSP